MYLLQGSIGWLKLPYLFLAKNERIRKTLISEGNMIKQIPAMRGTTPS